MDYRGWNHPRLDRTILPAFTLASDIPIRRLWHDGARQHFDDEQLWLLAHARWNGIRHVLPLVGPTCRSYPDRLEHRGSDQVFENTHSIISTITATTLSFYGRVVFLAQYSLVVYFRTHRKLHVKSNLDQPIITT